MAILIQNIKQLLGTKDFRKAIKGNEMKNISMLENAWLVIENEKIKDFGEMSVCPESIAFDEVIDASGRLVFPSFIDSHTHLVFAKSRESEFEDRINGLTYEQIAQRGGGILNSAKAMKDISEEKLYEDSLERLYHWAKWGTGFFEIKSGYGLDLEGELKMLRVIKKLKLNSGIPIKSTFLGAHAYPMAYKDNHTEYLKMVVEEILPEVIKQDLAEYIDVFCERGFFSVEESEYVIKAAVQAGLKPKIHANQLYNSGGIQLGVKYNAISVDHLETMDEDEIICLQNSNTLATLLPGAAFFLAMHYQPARQILDANIPVAIASDFNPGSCPSGNIPFMLTLACTQMKMTPAEAFHAVTTNGAAALEILENFGTIAKGKIANIIISQPMDSFSYIPYYYTSNPVYKHFIYGKCIN